MKAKFGAALALAVMARGMEAQGVTAATAARIDSVFTEYSGATPGCAVDVRKDTLTIYAHQYGLASLETATPITSRTVFNIASASKEFTAASVLLLAQDGKLSLDDDIRKYVPELPDLGAVVTLRQLLTHTSGWRDYVQMLVWQGHEVRDHVTGRDALSVLQRQRALNNAPGAVFRYSNTGYFLMSLVVQRVSGDSLGVFARKRIFEPLGMRDTRYVPDVRTVIADRAVAYEPASKGVWREAMSGWEQVGDGGVYTTIADMARWDDNFVSGRVGGRALIDTMSKGGTLRSGVPVPYGLGLFVDRYAGQRRVWHNGIWAGYRSVFMRFPDAELTIIALCNAADAPSELQGDAIARILLPPEPVAPMPAGAVLRVADASQMAGIYYNDVVNARLAIVADSGGLATGGASGRRLIPLDHRRYRVTGTTSVVEFAPGVGEARTMTARTDGRESEYIRVGPVLPDSLFGDYAGRYRSDELGVEMTVVVASGKVSLRDARGEDSPLNPIFRDAFDGVGTVRFERGASGAVTAMTLTSHGVSALPFVREDVRVRR